MRIEHRSASRHITDEQGDQATEEKERRPNFARAEIKVRLSKINSDAGREQAPRARMLISETSEAKGEHVNQGPILAVGIGREQRDQPCHDVCNDLIFLRDSFGGHTLADPI
jgi:hypothetical protein